MIGSSENPGLTRHEEGPVDANVVVKRKNKPGVKTMKGFGKNKKWRKAVQELGYLPTQTDCSESAKLIRNLSVKQDYHINPLRRLTSQTTRDTECGTGRTWHRVIVPSFSVSFGSEVAEKRYQQFVSEQSRGRLMLLNGIGALVKLILIFMLAVPSNGDWTVMGSLTVLVTMHLLTCTATRFLVDPSKLRATTWFLLTVDTLMPFAVQYPVGEASEVYVMCQLMSLIFITYTLIADTLKAGLRMAMVSTVLHLVMLIATLPSEDCTMAVRKVASILWAGLLGNMILLYKGMTCFNFGFYFGKFSLI